MRFPAGPLRIKWKLVRIANFGNTRKILTGMENVGDTHRGGR